MTKQSETPTRRAKRVRINEDNNEVQVIRVENADAAPSIAARNHVKAAVASHPEAIQRIAISLSKEFVSLTAKFQQKSKTQTKLDGDDNFIPRSARVAFKLTAPPSIMETTAFKALSAAMDEKTKEYSEFCKKSIASVAALVNEEMKTEIAQVFIKGLSQLATLVLTQQDPYRKEQPVDYFTLYILTDLDQSVFDATFASKLTLQTTLMTKLTEDADGPVTQPTVEIPATFHGPFALIKQHFQKLLVTVFVESTAAFNKKMKENETTKCLERQATKFLTGDATIATAMELDTEPSADPKTLRDLVNKAVQAKTAKMQSELQKLHDSVKRHNPTEKNSTWGASSSSNKQSASSTNKNEGKNEKKKDDNGKKNDGKAKSQTPRKKRENSDAHNANDTPKGKKAKKQPSGPSSQKKKSPKQKRRSNQS